MSDEQPAVVVKDLYKSFKLPHEQYSGIKQLLVNFANRKKGYEVQHVLDDISFEIKKGEFFGIVGRNGSGKSTLLKLLAGIYAPDKGLVQVNGSLTPFIELGVGFNPELTGRENVFLNGALLGFGRTEMEAMYDDIVKFAELDRFMDQKLKNYSSGMQVRLAFSIAIRARSDILLIDEVLAVGDAAFQQKCFDYFDKLKQDKRTIILVTHDMSAVKQFCDRAMFVKDGKLVMIGDPGAISREYEKANFANDGQVGGAAGNDAVTLKVLNNKEKAIDSISYGKDMDVVIEWDNSVNKVGIVGVVIYRGVEPVFATNSISQPVDLSKGKAVLRIKADIGSGRYKISAAIFGKTRRDLIASSSDYLVRVYDQPTNGSHDDEWVGTTYLENSWLSDER